MFTGIIEEIGTVQSAVRKEKAVQLTIAAQTVLADCKIGDSIAVNGICLTVIAFSKTAFSAEVMHETLSKTSLSALKNGSKVNLERAMPLNGRFGGHIVSGHIDGTGTVCKIQKDGIATWYEIRTTPQIMRYIVPKGSICIDGISLTVAKVTKDTFSVSLIPHTSGNTTLSMRKVSDTVNLENDMVGKYIEKLISRGG